MKAVRISQHGGPEVLEVVDVPPPEPGPGQLLVDVAAAGVNYRDVYEREGRYGGGLPAIIGVEGAGAVAGFDLVLKKYGTRDYRTLLAPAIEAAAKGHPISFWGASMHAGAVEKLSPYPSSLKALLKNGKPFDPGDLFVQPDLARTLGTIASEGAESFYRGSIARLTAGFYEKKGGLVRFDDLAGVRDLLDRDPVLPAVEFEELARNQIPSAADQPPDVVEQPGGVEQ